MVLEGTVSATDMVSFRSLSKVATSCTMALSSSGGKLDNDMVLFVCYDSITREYLGVQQEV